MNIEYLNSKVPEDGKFFIFTLIDDDEDWRESAQKEGPTLLEKDTLKAYLNIGLANIKPKWGQKVKHKV